MPATSIEDEVKHDNPSTVSRDVATESSGEESRPAAPPPFFNEQTNYVPLSTIITIFLACSTVDLVAVMDQTTLAGSLSIIGNTLDASNKTSWISGGYFLTSTCFQLLYGRLSDIWSRKYVLYVGLAIMFFGSLASSLSQTATQLIIFRAFTGIGGGGITSIAQMIVSDVVPLRERGKYQGILGAVIAIANGIGPVIGGALSPISHNSWRWIFRLMLPLTAISILAVMFFMPLRKVTGNWKAKLKAVDFFGVFLALGGTAVLMLGLTWGGGEYVWKSAHVLATLVVGFAVCVAFVLWEWKGHPFIRNLGGTLGLAVSGTIINNLLSTTINTLHLTTSEKQSFLASPSNYLSKLPEDEAAKVRALLIPAYKRGFRIVFTVNAALAALAFLLAVGLMPQVGLERADDERLKEEGRRGEQRGDGED
ncbi:MFS drug transporter [Aspergillus luchuensis]|uniref:MFS drug transporter n=1 Tax=Aspergillus kawachii TaxID=1069201 RepID=A0A146FJ39_ASPKA|nr:MFS drug transporter [Aspergillus luchuensis]